MRQDCDTCYCWYLAIDIKNKQLENLIELLFIDIGFMQNDCKRNERIKKDIFGPEYKMPEQQKIMTTKKRTFCANTRRTLSFLFAMVITLTFGSFSATAQDSVLLNEDYPDRYTVIKGDTLWDISGRFLRDPWRWPEVWQGNPQVDNPDLIFPGDVLVMTFIDGRPVLKALRRETVKLSPQARETRFSAIPLVDPAAIAAYINAPLVTDSKEVRDAAYVVDGFDNRLLLGKYDKFYARGFKEKDAEKYRVFRPGRQFVDPVSRESLGWEAVHVGDANMLAQGDPSKLVLSRAYEEVKEADRLRPVYEEDVLPFLAPRAPDNRKLRGVILDPPNRVTELGALSVVAVNLGERENVQVGDVFRIKSQRQQKDDPVRGGRYFIPEEDVGLLLVFRTFEKVSYALITDTERQVRPGDVLVSPDAEAIDASAEPDVSDVVSEPASKKRRLPKFLRIFGK